MHRFHKQTVSYMQNVINIILKFAFISNTYQFVVNLYFFSRNEILLSARKKNSPQRRWAVATGC